MTRGYVSMLAAGTLALVSLAVGRSASAQAPAPDASAVPVAAVAAKPLPAKAILDAAMQRASRERKPIFLMFDASW